MTEGTTAPPTAPPSIPVRVATARLLVPVLTAEEVRAMRAGARRPEWHADFPREDDLDGVGMWQPGDCWASRAIHLDGVVVGTMGFFGPPDRAADGVWETEVGYGLVAGARGLGVATEALLALLAHTDAAGVRIRASVLPDNQASLRVLAKAGFTELRGTSEDGELVMARPVR